MTQPPYVPSRDDDNTPQRASGWPPASQEVPAGQQSDSELFASQFPDPATTDPTYSEPVSSVSTGGDFSTGQAQSTKDVAKDQAADVKDTAVQQGQQVAGVAKEQATAVKDTALEQGQQVAGVAKEQVTRVASEAGSQIKDLLTEGLSEVRSQAGSQQKRLADGVKSLAGELSAMASKSDQSGPLTDYAQQASRKGEELARWLENAEPSDVLDYVRSFARRRPAAFLGISALAGAAVGRLTRGFVANAKSESQASLTSGTSTYASDTSAYATGTTPYASGTSTYATGTSGYDVGTTAGRENISIEEIPTSGSGYGPTTDRPDYDPISGVEETGSPYGTGRDGGTR